MEPALGIGKSRAKATSLTALSEDRGSTIALGVYPPLSRVVVVDDAENDTYLLSHLLEKAGLAMAPQVFTTGETALTFLADTASRGDPLSVPSVMFIDVWLPGLGGFGLLKWMREQEPLQKIVTIMLSGSDEPRNLGKAGQLGADCYLVKFPSPSGMRDLLDAIQQSLTLPVPRPPLNVSCNLLLTAK